MRVQARAGQGRAADVREPAPAAGPAAARHIVMIFGSVEASLSARGGIACLAAKRCFKPAFRFQTLFQTGSGTVQSVFSKRNLRRCPRPRPPCMQQTRVRAAGGWGAALGEKLGRPVLTFFQT